MTDLAVPGGQPFPNPLRRKLALQVSAAHGAVRLTSPAPDPFAGSVTGDHGKSMTDLAVPAGQPFPNGFAQSSPGSLPPRTAPSATDIAEPSDRTRSPRRRHRLPW
jgi:hypothetical protein